MAIQVRELTRTPGHGRQVALAWAEVTVDGIEIVIQGIRVVRRGDGLVAVEMPEHRHLDGTMVPSIVLPEELDDALQRLVLAHLAPGAVQVPLGAR